MAQVLRPGLRVRLTSYPCNVTDQGRNLSPGGYIEVSDVCFPILCDDDSMKPDSTLYVWSELQREAAAKIGRNLDSAKQYKSEMERVGFTDIVLTKYTWPLNRWPKDPKYKELGML